MQEVWKDIKGYEGIYKISNYGRVKSLISNKMLKIQTYKTGYKYVPLHKKGIRKNIKFID